MVASDPRSSRAEQTVAKMWRVGSWAALPRIRTPSLDLARSYLWSVAAVSLAAAEVTDRRVKECSRLLCPERTKVGDVHRHFASLGRNSSNRGRRCCRDRCRTTLN